MKLRLPHKFQAALIAALASVSFTTLSSGTIAVATGAALLAGQQAQANVTEKTTTGSITVGDKEYISTAPDGVVVVFGDRSDTTSFTLGDITAAEYTFLTSWNGSASDNGRYKVDSAAATRMANYGTIILANGTANGGTYDGGLIFVQNNVTIANDLILGTGGYTENNYDGTIRMSGGDMFTGDVLLAQDTKFTVAGSGNKFTGPVSGTGKTLTLQNNGAITFTGDVELGKLNITGTSTVSIIGSADNKSNIDDVDSAVGSTLYLTNANVNLRGDNSQGFKSSLVIGQGAKVTVKDTDSMQWSNANNTITLLEGGLLDFESKRLSVGAKTTIVMAGGEITGVGDNTRGALDFHENGATIRATADSTISATVNLRNNGQTTNFDVNGGTTLTLSGTVKGSGNLHKLGAGTLVISRNASYSGSTTLDGGTLKVAQGGTLAEGVFTAAAGTAFVNEGTATIGMAGANSTLASTVQNTGSLTLKGTINVLTADMTAYEVALEGTVKYDGEAGTIYEGSGHLSLDTTQYYLVKSTGSGTLANNATIAGVGAYDKEGESLLFTRTTGDTTTYYVNSNLTYNEEVMGSSTNLVVAKGASLTTNSVSDVTNKVLHGSGSYAALNRVGGNKDWSSGNGYGLGVGVTLGTDWTGTVVVSGSANNTEMLDLDKLGNNGLGTVEIKGLDGWTKNWNGTVAANIKLTNGSNGYAWKSTGSTGGSGTAVYTGAWSGDGTIQTEGNKLWWRYEGDVSDWTGTFHVNSGFPTLTFTKAATTVNATIEKGGGTLTLETKEADVTFNKAVEATYLTVRAGSTATFNANTTITDGITADGAGTVVVGDGRTLTLGRNAWTTGSDNFATNFVVGEGSTLIMEMTQNNAKTYTGDFTFKNGSTLNKYDGALKLTGKITLGENEGDLVKTHMQWDKNGFEFAGLVEGKGTVRLVGKGGNDRYLFSGANGGFTGEMMVGIKADGNVSDNVAYLDISGETALQHGIINLAGGNKAQLRLAGPRVTIGGLRGTSGSAVNLASDTAAGILTISGNGTYEYAGSLASNVGLNLTGTGTQKFTAAGGVALSSLSGISGTLDVTGTLILTNAAANDFGGTLAVGGLTKAGEGALTLHGISRLGNTIDLQGGSLVFGAGQYDLSATTATHNTVYSEGTHGYATTTDVVQLVNTGTNVSTSGATFSYTSGGETLTSDTVSTDGTVSFAHAQDKTTYVLTDGTSANLTDIMTLELQNIRVASGTGTITTDETAFLSGGIQVQDGATAKIDAAGQVIMLYGASSFGSNAHVQIVEGSKLSLCHEGTAAAVIKAATGAGNIDLDVNATLANGVTTAATGTLTIGEDVTLTIGTGDGQNNNLSSFSNIVLNGGKIYWNSAGGEANKLQGLTVSSTGGTFQIYDINTAPIVLAGTTTLAGDLTLINGNWGDKLTIDKLSGTGSLNATSESSSDALTLTIGSIEDFTGGISIANSATTLNATLGSGANLASITTGGTVSLTLSDDAAVAGEADFGSGNVTVAGAHTLSVGGLTGTGTMNVAGNLTINVAEGETYTYTGLQSLGGKLTKSGDGAQALTLGTEQNPFQLNEAIALTGGSLTLGGHITLKDGAFEPSGEGNIKYVDLEGGEHEPGTGSGYEAASGTVTVVDITDATLAIADNTTFTYKGKEVIVGAAGTFQQPGTPAYNAYYIFTDPAVSLSAVQTFSTEKGDPLTDVYLHEGGTLTGGSETKLPTLHVVATEATGDVATLAGTGTTAVASVTGEGTLSVEGTLNVDALDIESGKTVTFAGSEAINVSNLVTEGTLGIAEGARVNASGDINLSSGHITTTGAGTLHVNNLHVNGSDAVVTLGSVNNLHQITMGAGTVNLNGNTTMERFVLSLNNAASTMNIGKDAIVRVTGTTLSVNNGEASFMVSNYNQTNTLNIEGTLIAEAGISSRDGSANVNVKNGGTLELHQGLLYTSNSNKTVNVNVENGGTLLTAGNDTDGTGKGLHVKLADGATLRGYYGSDGSASTVSIAQALSLTGSATGTGATIEVGSGKTIKLASAITNDGSGKMNVTGGGTLQVSGTNGSNFHDVAVADGTTVEIIGKNSPDYRLRYTLDGGTLTSSGDATSDGHVQNDQITLTKNSTISGTANYYMLGASYGQTALNLQDHTLTKAGTNTVSLINTDVSTGTIKVTNGTLNFVHRSDKPDSRVEADIELAGGTISGTYTYKASDSAVTRNLTVNQSAVTNAAITIGSNVTLNANVAANQVLTLGGAITGSGNFEVSGTGTLKLAGAGMISVNDLTFGSGSTLDVSNVAQMAGITVNLASYTGTTAYTGVNITGVNSGLEYTLNNANGQLTLTFSGEQTLPNHFTPDANLGNVMYVGDSITDGVTGQKSWRYSFFQVLADSGVSQTEQGYYQHHQSSGAIPEGQTATYGDHTFQNTHSAQASARSWETAGKKDEARYGHSYIKNWLGQDGKMRNGADYTGAVYKGDNAPNTYFMLLGTNDLLSEGGSNNHATEASYNATVLNMFGYDGSTYDGTTGTFDIILDSMLKARSDAQLVVMEMPTWNPSRSGNHDAASDFAYMIRFNQVLVGWAANNANKEHITVVDPNRGIIDVANTTKPGAGVANMFISDGLHPSAQGELIIAGNVAQQLGYAGRSIGLDRASYTEQGAATWTAADNTTITVTAAAQTFAADAFHTPNGYTVDFGALYGDGATGDWSASSNALTVQVGDGYNTGTLTFSEAYVMWGNTILYSRDNSQEGGNFRIAYVNQSVDETDHVSTGYYVWMGDMLIGEALAGISGDFNGIQLTSTGAEGTVKNLTWSDTAYAPTTKGYVNEADAFHLVQDNVLPTHNNPERFITQDFSGAQESTEWLSAYQGAEKEGYRMVSTTASASGSGQWYAGLATKNTNYEGDLFLQVADGAPLNANAIFGVVNTGTVTGNVTVQMDASTGSVGRFTSGAASVIGGYAGSITGTFKAVMNAGTLQYGIVGGFHTANSGHHIGAVELDINGGTVEGNVYGGSVASNGLIDHDVAINVAGGKIAGNIFGGGTAGTIGGDVNITITGGVITGNVNGGGTGGTINGSTNVTIEGILPSIGGNISAQNVTLKDVVDSGHGYTDGFDTYAGTINATNKLTLDNYQVGEMLATVNATRLEATHGTVTTINNMGPGAVAITVDEDSSLTLGNVRLSSAITNDGSITFAGNVILDDMTATHTDESYVDGKVEGNGFYSSKSSVAVFTVEHVGSVDISEANMTYKGAEGTMDATGVFTTNEVAKDLTTFYIKSQAENLSTVTGVSADATVTMSDATKLVVDGTGTIFSTDKIVLAEGASGATLEIGNGNTATAGSANKSLTLTGSGIYRLNNASRDMKGAQLHSSDWTGSVEVSGSMGVKDCSFDGLANANSTVLMSGAYFWWNPNTVSAQNANIRLNDAFKDNGQSGTANGSALQISGTNAGANYVFNGAFTGAGDFAYVNANSGDARNANFFLRGDLSGWTGDFVNYNGTTGTHPTLHLDGTDAVVLGGGIVQKSTGALNVNLGGNNSTSVTVNGDVAVEEGGTLNLTANKETTFNGSVGASNLTVSAGTTVTTKASLDVSGTTAVNQGGTLNIMNIAESTSLSVGDVTIGAGATMGVYADADAVTEATLEIASGKTLTAAGEGATLNGNLELAAGSHLDVRNTDNDVAGLIMGSTVTLNQGVILDDYDATTWAGWADGTKYALFTGVDGLNIGSGTGTAAIDYTQWVDAKEYFTNIEEANRYFLCYGGAAADNQNGVLQASFDGSNVGMVYVMVMPEPTTGTLSLLALAALAARRRRK